MMDPVSVSASGSQSGLQPQQGVPYDLESGFEPQTRARSHTWPLPRSEGYIDGNVVANVSASKEGVEGGESSTPPRHGSLGQGTSLLPVKKNSSRRNAWGNHSYADLITQAITSAPDERLTLSQIYEWMMQNIPFFREKGESNSSAGWKVILWIRTLVCPVLSRDVTAFSFPLNLLRGCVSLIFWSKSISCSVVLLQFFLCGL
ncbi:forkhead box protein O-like [Colletes gigas]|uniref:forkhead box protein O-like n=1 Tax=Colletes gigas TaxID=935657 RepID=UPI001C9B732C|nr:forkhead box protein O-like [Colletes gigas]